MSGNGGYEDELFDDVEAEEERLASAEQAEIDAADADETSDEPEELQDPIGVMHRVINELQAENEGLKDKMLRTVAEMENLRRRTAKEVADVRSYSTSNFARDMLAVGDNLRRAIEAVPQEARDQDEAGLKALIEGVEMTERDMLNALEKNGVKKLNPKNEKFDPHFHQAIFEIANSDVPNNSVIEVVQEGYVIADRMLRPAMVGVAKGGPKFVAKEDGAKDAGEEAAAKADEAVENKNAS